MDKCPMAYKDMSDIVDNVGDTVDIVEMIKPVPNDERIEGCGFCLRYSTCFCIIKQMIVGRQK